MAIAPGRAKRPGAGRAVIPPPSPEELETCPFCEGREDQTPPETLALGREAGGPDAPGWRVRVVPNLFPALERQEVVVHSPRHVRTVAELDDDELELVAQAWSLRARAAEEAGFPYVHALVNEGREAGSSLPHSHSQLAWLRELPPAAAREESGACGICAVVEQAEALAEEAGIVASVHPAGRLPYECLIAPRDHGDGPFGASLFPALRLLVRTIRLLHAAEGPVPLNAWLHHGGHWHLELVPRLTVLAGIELGAEIYVNSLAPEDAAAALRGARDASA